MQEQIISFELAKAAKDKGFPQKLENTSWYNKEGILNGKVETVDKVREPTYKAPTQSLLAKWLREKHNIFITITNQVNTVDDETPNATKFLLFNWEIKYLSSYTKKFEEEFDYFERFNTYEEALEEALFTALNYITNEQKI